MKRIRKHTPPWAMRLMWRIARWVLIAMLRWLVDLISEEEYRAQK